MVKKVPCPACKTDREVVWVLYGYPDEKGQEMALKGEVVLGGCIFDIGGSGEGDPLYACKVCKTLLPEYGTHKDLREALKNKDMREVFREKERELIGKSYILTEEEIQNLIKSDSKTD